MVVAGRPAGGEGIVKPKMVLSRDLIGNIREGRGAFVGGDHQIRIVTVVANRALGRHHLAAFKVVGEVEKT